MCWMEFHLGKSNKVPQVV
ncbi:rCG36834 [Rattus norvegicus]|uniref:RCG36834 n=1 Tax=Rattus norvegicus TaxID=10116 RepID=A6HTH1_RAT|nr:rCG36834 [Rattus norvegicus]